MNRRVVVVSDKVLIPEKARIVGGSGEGTVKIYISREIYKEIFSFSKDKNIYQSGGVLLGNTVVQDDCRYVIVKAFIEAKYSEGTSNSITFTKDTWNYIDMEREKYPEYDLVGWMHTNPDTGCLASEYDVFFQTHMFENKGIITYIVDPVQIVEAFYYLEGESLLKCDGFYVYAEATMPKNISQKKFPKEKKKEKKFIEEDEFIKLVEDEPAAEMLANVSGEIQASDTNEEKTCLNSTEEKTDIEGVNGEEEMRQVFEKAEQKVEADKSDLEAFTGRPDNFTDKHDETPMVRSSSKDKAIVAILIVLVIALAATLAVAIVRICQLEKDIKKLYQNDEVIARYINTGKAETTADAAEQATAQEGQSETKAAEETKQAETTAEVTQVLEETTVAE